MGLRQRADAGEDDGRAREGAAPPPRRRDQSPARALRQARLHRGPAALLDLPGPGDVRPGRGDQPPLTDAKRVQRGWTERRARRPSLAPDRTDRSR
ncbi:MAG: hypothetical protein AVDCRST_MAG49-4602 [uncultured Thermomicrobiales bacterium]|uniref:Uncharacterized protein n=1 Tax=uncultured Thermomicrobiales bacterium TaxID=1645740 RepID=A0A6J4VPC7_9BACT|nr:MAG: hypothetical protein AVDCRST_MAG49-4602 [uncultured Thermomicrobiales bacterium]